MPKMQVILVIVAAVGLSACATKRYPIATPLSATEVELMDCRQLEIEMAETDSIRSQIIDTAETDWRSIAGFLGDYGIGNAMARSEADQALQRRQDSIRAAQVRQGC